MLSAVVPISAVVSAEAVGDPESTRRVYATIVIFLALGVAMVVLAIWLFRRTRPEPQLLAPLEAMDSRRWRRSEPAQRGRELDEKRPVGARPLHRAADRPEVDSEFAITPPVRSFDDLAEGATGSTESDADPAAVETIDGEPADVAPADGEPTDDESAAIGDEGADPTPIGSDPFLVPDDPLVELLPLVDDADAGDELPPPSGGPVDEPEPVMPGEGLLRRHRDPSS